MAGLLLSDAELEARVLRLPHVAARIAELGDEVEKEGRAFAQQRAYETGVYAASIHLIQEPGPERRVRAEGHPDKPALPTWLERGTGIYGPKRTPITPKNGEFLIFRPGDQRGFAVAPTTKKGGWVKVRSVKGREASHVMRDAGVAVAERHGLRWVPSS